MPNVQAVYDAIWKAVGEASDASPTDLLGIVHAALPPNAMSSICFGQGHCLSHQPKPLFRWADVPLTVDVSLKPEGAMVWTEQARVFSTCGFGERVLRAHEAFCAAVLRGEDAGTVALRVAKEHSLAPVRSPYGHGIGRLVHQAPILTYDAPRDVRDRRIALEPAWVDVSTVKIEGWVYPRASLPITLPHGLIAGYCETVFEG